MTRQASRPHSGARAARAAHPGRAGAAVNLLTPRMLPGAAGPRTTMSVLAALACGVYVWIAIWLGVLSLVPALFGWRPLVVSSDSMSPAIRAGDVVVTSPSRGAAPAGEGRLLAVGTVVAFRDDGRSRLVLHRVAGVSDGAYRTKGDANRVIDSAPVPAERVEGVARLLIPWAGLPFYWLSTGRWWLALMLVGSLALAWWAQGSPARGAPDRRTTPPRETPASRT